MSDDHDLRELARAARASVTVTDAETEVALADVTSGTLVARLRPADEPGRRGWPVWLAAAAATALVVGAGLYFLVGGDDRVSTVDSTVPVTVPPTPPVQTVPGTTPASSPDTAPGTPDPFAGLQRHPTGIERRCVDEYICTSLFADPDDVVYACDPATNVLTRYGDDTLSAQLPNCQVVAVGPARVAYVLSDEYEYDGGATGYDLIAISMADEDAGAELFRWPPHNPVDTELVPTPDGLASVSFHSDDPQPDLARLVAFEWVTRDPETDLRDIPVAQFDPGNATRLPAFARDGLRWELDSPVHQTTVPLPTDDGGVIATLYDIDDVDNRLVRGWPNGTISVLVLPSIRDVDRQPTLLERSGTILVPDGDTFARIDPFESHTSTTQPTTTTAVEPPATTVPDTTPTTEPTPEVPAFTEPGPVLDGLYYEYSGIGRECTAEGWCTQVVFDPSGAPVSFDPTSGTVTRHIDDTGGPAQFTLPADVEATWLIAAGPDDVVYVAVRTDEPEASDVVAYSLTADDAGREVARFPAAIGIGDFDLVPGPDGLVMVGWYGQGMQPPEPFNVVIGWVDRAGQPTTSPRPIIRSDFYGITIEIGEREWTFDDPLDGAHPTMPPITPTFDGGFVAVYYHGADGRTAVVRGWSDGTVDTWLPPADAEPWMGLVPEPSGHVLVPNGNWFARAELFPHREADYWMGQRGTGSEDGIVSTPGLDEFLDANDPWWEHDVVGFANAVAGPPGWPGEIRSIRVDPDDEPQAVVTRERLGDDSVAGTQLRFLFVDMHAADLRVDRVEWTQRCQPDRGHQDYTTDYCI